MMNFAGILKLEETANTKSETFGDRILLVLEQQGRSKSWLANQLGISKQSVNYLLRHSSSTKHMNEIASLLEINPEWLLSGQGRQQISDMRDTAILQIPILKFDDIHGLLKQDNIIDQSTEFTHLQSDAITTNKCYATVLNNSSMEPLFSPGTLLIFNPILDPKNGDFILLSADENVFFRRYFIEGNQIYLKAFDSMYQSFNKEEIDLLGVLIESRKQFK